MKITFCPNCGAKLQDGAAFCPNCGQAVQPATTGLQAATVTQPKKRWPFYTSLVVLGLLVIGFFSAKTYYTPQRQLQRTVTAIRKGRHGVAKQFITTDTKLKLTDQAVKPLTRYFKKYPSELATFQTALQNNNQFNGTALDGGYRYLQSGHYWLFFPRYRLQVQPVYPRLSTNHRNVKLYVDGKKMATSSSDYYSKVLSPLVPGRYNLKAAGTVGGHHMVNQSNNNILSSTAYDLSLKTVSFNVQSYPNAVAYLNGKKVGTLDSTGMLAISDYPWASQLGLTLQYQGSAGKVVSKTKKIHETDDGITLTVGFPGVISHTNADSLFNDVYRYVADITDTGDNSAPSDFAKLFVNGSSNSEYQEYVKMARGYHDDDNVDSVSYQVTMKHVVPDKRNVAKVTYDVEYDFYSNPDDEDTEDEHIQVYRYTAKVVKTGTDDYRIDAIAPAQQIKNQKINASDDD